MIRALAFLALAVLLVACDGGGQQPAQPVKQIEVRNDHHEGLMALSPDLQRLALMRAIRDSGKRCQRVDAGAYQETYRGLKMWVARCNDERSWAVYIAPNGDVQVSNCADAAQLGLPQCREVRAEAAPAATG